MSLSINGMSRRTGIMLAIVSHMEGGILQNLHSTFLPMADSDGIIGLGQSL